LSTWEYLVEKEERGGGEVTSTKNECSANKGIATTTYYYYYYYYYYYHYYSSPSRSIVVPGSFHPEH